MLALLGKEDIGYLFSSIDDDIRQKKDPWISSFSSEQELKTHMLELAEKNDTRISFAGAGCYNHYIPSAIDHIISESGLYTSYTPYQSEASQGILQALFEYQSLICDLTGQQISNASMYDGSTALAEACFMSRNITGRNKIIVSEGVHPHYVEVLKTYCSMGGLRLETQKLSDGVTKPLKADDSTCAVIVQSPNFYGCIEDTERAFSKAEEAGSLRTALVLEMTSLGILEPPSCDIFVAEAQALGIPRSFGGPSLGVLSAKREYMRKMPARLVGQTTDPSGRKGYCLTLQAREQHIRRERATSNICTSQTLCAIAAAAYLSLLGPKGLLQVARSSHSNAVYLCQRLCDLDDIDLAYDAPFYNEFSIRCPKDSAQKIMDAGYGPGVTDPKDPEKMILAVTEMHSKDDMDGLFKALK